MNDKAISELKVMLTEAEQNRTNDKWEGFIQGIKGAIYRLEMTNEAMK